MPEEWLTEEESEEKKYSRQMQVVAFYQTEKGEKEGVTLFRGKEKPGQFKFLARDAVFGRALGFGGAEELFEPQVWVNYGEAAKQQMLANAAKVILQTTDPAFKSRNSLDDLDNNEVVVTEQNSDLRQIDLAPRNAALFDNAIAEWEAHGQMMGSANDSNMGIQPTSGTPFKLQELVTQQSNSLHKYRQGKIATFVDEIYRDWIIPYFARELSQGTEFLTELTLDEMNFVVDAIANKEVNELVLNKILEGEIPQDDEVQQLRQEVRANFFKEGNKKFIKVMEKEMAKENIDVFTNIVGKQRDMAERTDKLVNVFRQIISNPEVFTQYPFLAKPFNQIIENSGLDPINFAEINTNKPQQAPVSPPTTEGATLQATI
jgi:hypothetical protein